MNKKIVHDALVLFAFTVVLGLILGVVYGITKGPIDQVNYEKTQSAYKQVFEDADSFEEYADFDTAAAEDLDGAEWIFCAIRSSAAAVSKSAYSSKESASSNTCL